MTMVYEITGNPDGTVTVDCRSHGKDETPFSIFYRKSPDYIVGYIDGAASAEDIDCAGELDEKDNRMELMAVLNDYLTSNPVEAHA